MAAIDGRTWLEHIDPPHCWELLGSASVGRVGVLNDSAPEIYPVNHAVDGQSIVFRTDPGTKLRSLLRSPAVCFEVDGVDPADATGWSVLVKGRAPPARPATGPTRRPGNATVGSAHPPDGRVARCQPGSVVGTDGAESRTNGPARTQA